MLKVKMFHMAGIPWGLPENKVSYILMQKVENLINLTEISQIEKLGAMKRNSSVKQSP